MKKVVTLVLVLVLAVFSALPAMAAELQPSIEANGVEDPVLPRAEETQWYYRTTNGFLEKRLWSITYGYWKTDWMPA